MASCDSSTPYYADFLTVTEALRCPVCGGQRVASSDSPFALTVKRDACAYLHQGMPPAQVIARLETDYGADLGVEDHISAITLPLVMILAALLILGLWKLRGMVGKSVR
jgi:cytochrome c-type biogenesis protein CcmH/NrfF